MNNLSSDLNIEVSRIERDVGVMDSDIYRLLSPAALLDTSDKVRAGRLSPGHSRDKLLQLAGQHFLRETRHRGEKETLIVVASDHFDKEFCSQFSL